MVSQASMSSGMPVSLSVDYPERLSRLLIFFKGLLVLPNAIVLMFYGVAAWFAMSIGWFVILFTGRLPAGLHNLMVNYLRWNLRVQAYTLLLTDAYPPYTGRADVASPVHLECARAERLSRGLIFVKGFLAIPHLFALAFVGFAAMVVISIAWWVILFTGKFPRGMFDFVVRYLRWSARVNAYVYLLRDEYPPFSGA